MSATRRIPARSRLAGLFESDVARAFLRSPGALVGGIALACFAVSALLPELVAPYATNDLRTLSLDDAFLPPAFLEGGDQRFLLGTDDQGRDLVSAIIHGLSTSLAIGAAGVLLALVVGVCAGLVAGFAGGTLDGLIMRVADVQLTFPAILIAVMLDGLSRASFGQARHEELAASVLVLSIALSGWVQYARPVRGATMVERGKDYVAAGRLIGLATAGILLRHILPNVLTPVLVVGTIHLGVAIILEATLSFVGLGMPPTEPSLGTLIRIGNGFLFSGEWWIAIVPGAVLVLLVVSINLVGDFLRDELNPRLR